MLGTFVIPVYNREKTIDRAIRSVAQQGLSGYEIIVVDDASTDNTLKIAREWSNRYPENIIVLPFKEHSERVICLNAGIRYARGEWVIPYDSDDEMASHFIKAFEQAQKRDPQAMIISWGGLIQWNQDDYTRTSVRDPWQPPIGPDGRIGLFRAGGIHSGGFAYKKRLIYENGFIPGRHNPYSQGEIFLRWHPEVKPLYKEGQTDLGNPWGQDYMYAYQLSRNLKKDEWVVLNQLLHVQHVRP